MPLTRKTKHRLVWLTAVIALTLLGAIGATFYFMQSVFEAENLLHESEVPESIKKSMAQEFPDAQDVQWKRDEELYEAKFDLKNLREVEAYFTADGSWVKKEFPTTFSALPLKAQAYLNQQKGCSVEDIERLEMKNGPGAFEVELVGLIREWDCIFDAEGNLLSRIRDGAVMDQPPPPRAPSPK